MIGQTLVWFGAYGAVEYICYVSPCTVVWKELFLSTAGLALLFLFDSSVEVSLVDTADVFNDFGVTFGQGRVALWPARTGPVKQTVVACAAYAPCRVVVVYSLWHTRTGRVVGVCHRIYTSSSA
jgi:hypothetical protein